MTLPKDGRVANRIANERMIFFTFQTIIVIYNCGCPNSCSLVVTEVRLQTYASALRDTLQVCGLIYFFMTMIIFGVIIARILLAHCRACLDAL